MTRFCRIFSQLFQRFPRTQFQKALVAIQAERHARAVACWGQFGAMLFCQLGRAHSLREICGGPASCEGQLAHLGLEAPARATPAYANVHRPWQLYEQVFYQRLARCQAVPGSKTFRFKDVFAVLHVNRTDGICRSGCAVSPPRRETYEDLDVSLNQCADERRYSWAIGLITAIK